MNRSETKKDLLLYIDIPFCPQHCSYCCKPALLPQAECREKYAEALQREVYASAGSVDDYEIKAVYIGGGIPGHMMDEQLGDLLHHMPEGYPIAKDCEITLKIHPGMFSVDTLHACSRGHITRLSIEYSTSNITEYEQLGRFLSPAAMDITKTVIGNKYLDLSFDLIIGIPGQTKNSLVSSVRKCLTYGAVHFCLYRLLPQQMDHSSPAALSDNPRKHIPSNEEVEEWMEYAAQFLEAEGFTEYLPGRFALPGKESLWYQLKAAGTEYLGFGLGAESKMDGICSGNTRELERYLQYADRPDKLIRYIR